MKSILLPIDQSEQMSSALTTAALLADHGLGDSPLFVVPESVIGAQGLLPKKAVETLRGWLHSLAADAAERQRVIRRTLDGALDSLDSRVLDLTAAAAGQVAAVGMLRTQVETAYHAALEQVTERVLARLSNQVGREMVAEVVAKVTERLVREEIERIKASIK